MTCSYEGLVFQTELLAQWAAFFDSAEWEWRMYPHAVGNWKPDFRVNFECEQKRCRGSHTLLVAVLPVSSADNLRHHPAADHKGAINNDLGEWVADAGAVFGNHPLITRWEFPHGADKNIFDVPGWVPDFDRIWRDSCALIREENAHLIIG